MSHKTYILWIVINMPNVTSNILQEKMTLTFLQIAVFLMVCADVTFDILEGLPMKAMVFDLFFEGIILIFVLISTNYIWRKFSLVHETTTALHEDLEKTKILVSHWEKRSLEFIKEFQEHLFKKLSEWNLTKSEKEITLLLLKGLSSKEIASSRFTSERTIRNQCRSIYQKANVSNKSELSAFFLNELLTDLSL